MSPLHHDLVEDGRDIPPSRTRVSWLRTRGAVEHDGKVQPPGFVVEGLVGNRSGRRYRRAFGLTTCRPRPSIARGRSGSRGCGGTGTDRSIVARCLCLSGEASHPPDGPCSRSRHPPPHELRQFTTQFGQPSWSQQRLVLPPPVRPALRPEMPVGAGIDQLQQGLPQLLLLVVKVLTQQQSAVIGIGDAVVEARLQVELHHESARRG